MKCGMPQCDSVFYSFYSHTLHGHEFYFSDSIYRSNDYKTGPVVGVPESEIAMPDLLLGPSQRIGSSRPW